MDHTTRLKMLTLAESKPPKPILLQMESGLGATDTTVDDHLKHAVHHAAASLTATRQGNHEDAAKHKQAANTHLLHASQKQNAEEHPGSHQGEKMVFGVWRKVGGDLSPAEHQKLGDDYTKHATRQKSRIDARAMLGGVHPHEVPEADKAHHYHEVKQALAMAKTHYAGQDPMKHTGDAGTQRTGPSGKPTVTAHGQASGGGGGKHHSVPMQYPSQSKVGHSGARDREDTSP